MGLATQSRVVSLWSLVALTSCGGEEWTSLPVEERVVTTVPLAWLDLEVYTKVEGTDLGRSGSFWDVTGGLRARRPDGRAVDLGLLLEQAIEEPFMQRRRVDRLLASVSVQTCVDRAGERVAVRLYADVIGKNWTRYLTERNPYGSASPDAWSLVYVLQENAALAHETIVAADCDAALAAAPAPTAWILDELGMRPVGNQAGRGVVLRGAPDGRTDGDRNLAGYLSAVYNRVWAAEAIDWGLRNGTFGTEADIATLQDLVRHPPPGDEDPRTHLLDRLRPEPVQPDLLDAEPEGLPELLDAIPSDPPKTTMARHIAETCGLPEHVRECLTWRLSFAADVARANNDSDLCDTLLDIVPSQVGQRTPGGNREVILYGAVQPRSRARILLEKLRSCGSRPKVQKAAVEMIRADDNATFASSILTSDCDPSVPFDDLRDMARGSPGSVVGGRVEALCVLERCLGRRAVEDALSSSPKDESRTWEHLASCGVANYPEPGRGGR